jgi:hypothetical protein
MADDALVLHPQWRAWVTRNLVDGATIEAVTEALVEEGMDGRQARALAEAIAREPGTIEAHRLQRRCRALELLVRLRRDHRGEIAIERRAMPSADELRTRYWAPGVPVIVTGLVTRWPAFGRWTPADLAARFGDVTIQACVGREGVSRPDADWAEVRRRLPLREFVALLDGGAGNDAYVIAKNDLLCNPALAPLLDEIELPPEIFGPRLDPTRMALWLGGAGTHTPLHHDTDNAMFAQVYGRKRLRLAPPESLALLDRSDGLYCRWDPRTDEDLRDAPEPLVEIELQAGEALFIPAGWWHQVDALTPSISVSNLVWAWPNDYRWYKPGTALAGRPIG